jgi:ATP-dependent protease ClpP protease subunit
MARSDERPRIAPEILASPQISLIGEIDKFSVERFLDQLRQAEQAGGDVALEVTTMGGDAEMARRIVLEVDTARSRLKGRFLFLGKTVVYSAGITIMSAFPCRDRWLAADAMLLIHGRKLDKTVEVSGPIRASIPMVEALLRQLKTGIVHEDENFRRLIDDCNIDLDELREKALHNWYLPAEEALERGLVGGIYRPGAFATTSTAH